MRSKIRRPVKAKVSKASCGDTSALHVKTEDGDNLIKIGNLRVVITRDGDRWIAQGLEIDYVAEGTSLRDVQTQFTAGLRLTIQEHCRIFGDVNRLLKVAPPAIWKEFMENARARQFTYSQIQTFQEFEQLAFPGITGYILKAA